MAQEDTTVYAMVEKQPEFVGGIPAMAKFINQNIKYPASALNAGISGKCFLKFIVNETGEISNIEVLRGVEGCPDCDEEAIRVLKAMPKWNAGLINGKPVKTYFTLPISYKMTDENGVVQDYMAKYRKMANDYYNAGVKNVSNNQLNLAVENFTRCLNLTSGDIDALYNLGTVYFKLNEKEKACETWNKIKALGKPDADDLIKQYCFAQEVKDTIIHTVVEQPAEFPEGILAMGKFLQKNIQYPAKARKAGIGGRCLLKFIVNETGEISDVEVIQGVPDCPDCDKEAVRVVKSMPKWKPALVKEKPVKCYFNLPIQFRP